MRIEEIKEKAGLDPSVLDDDVMDEVQNYLANRRKKAEALAEKRGMRSSQIMESMLESEEEDIGQELKAAIVDASGQTRLDMLSAAKENKDLIFDVKEE